MNTQNYASLEASKKLYEAGIVLETERVWYKWAYHPKTDLVDWGIIFPSQIENELAKRKLIPAPCFTEVWRELPEQCDHECLKVSKDEGRTFCGYGEYADRWENTNPTDALIDLLVWLKGEGK